MILSNHIAEETPPKAGAMINTFRVFGYKLQTAKAGNGKIKKEWLETVLNKMEVVI